MNSRIAALAYRQHGDLPKHAHPIERLIAHDLINAIVGAEYNVSIWDGEEYAIKYSTDVEEILSAMSHTGEDNLQIYDAGMVFPRDRETAYEGFIYLVYGNEPENLVADYSGPEWIANIIEDALEVLE